MKKIFTLFALSLFIISCSDEGNSYTINGTVADETMNGRTLYLSDYDTDKNIDTTLVTDGKFTFTGSYDSPTMLRIDDENHNYYANILAENTVITVVLADESVVSSDGINDEFKKMEKQIDDVYLKMRNLRDSLSKIHPDKDELQVVFEDHQDKFDSFSNSIKQIQHSFLAANKENSMGAVIAHRIIRSRGITITQIDSLLNEVPLIRNYGPITRKYNTIKIADATSVGKPFADFAAKNVDGTPAKLSDFVGKGKYVLADFWASWCGPCTAELPNLKYLHDNYPDLVVLGVNVWDSEEKFHKFLKEKNNKWSMLYCEGSVATDLYGIDGIPTIILFDPQGVIVDRTFRGEGMKKKIAEIFKK